MAQTATQVVHLSTRRRRQGASSKAPAYRPDTDEKLARIIFNAIESELRDVDFFTREDLLQLRVLQSVATITRYHMVCHAIHWLVNSRRLVQLNRTEISFSASARKNSGPDMVEEYGPTIRRLITRWSNEKGGAFDVMDLLSKWTTDPHLTTNAKRVALRIWLKYLRREGTLRDGPSYMTFLAQGD